jgi:hypothetical protein
MFNRTKLSSLVIAGASTFLSTLNRVENIIGSGTALTSLNNSAILNPPAIVNLNLPEICVSCSLRAGQHDV